MKTLAPQIKITTGICVSGAVVMMLFTWFTVTALMDGEIPMRSAGPVTVIDKEVDPDNYWLCTGVFALITLIGWFAIGLNLYRIHYKTK